MHKTLSFIALLIIFSFGGSALLAQAKRKPRTAKPKTVTQEVQSPASPEVVVKTESTAPIENTPTKRNGRAETTNIQTSESSAPLKKNNSRPRPAADATPSPLPFAYEFSQPQFVISKVLIEHSENGEGHITFEKQNVGEPVTDPIEISAKALENIKRLWAELNFLDSTEDYQSTKYKYPHLGVMKLRQQQNGKNRQVTFNWTENKAAKDLTDEYKKLTEQFIWLFDMNLARENQPLSAPQLVDRFESLLRRNQISDPQQMLPYLREVSDDERLPLIARNHTSKLIKNIEKQKEK